MWNRKRTERGATIVEAAIVTPVVFLAILALIDGGLFFAQHASIGYSTRTGARAASASGADGAADYDVLQAVRRGLVAMPESRIDRVVVYKAKGYDDPPSATCASGVSVSGNGIGACNVYTPADFKRPFTSFGESGWAKDDHYAGWLRNNHRGATDYVGVYIEARCMCSTGLLARNGKVSNQTVIRLEAKQL